jgi:hypothetical protein
MKGIFICFCLLASVFTVAAVAQTPEERGLSIAREAERHNQGWVDSAVELKMVLTNSLGETSERNMRLLALEVNSEADGDKSLTYFLSPADVEGTALLTFTKLRTEDDDQWLYLPALKRVRRIASANKSSSFAGSEFFYEDFLAQEVEKFTYRFLREEPCPTAESESLTCFVTERAPVYRNSGYSKQISWVDTAEYRTWKLDFFNRRGEQSKMLTFSDYRQYGDRFWRSHTLQMDNLLTGKKTTLAFGTYTLNSGMDRNVFHPDALVRLR